MTTYERVTFRPEGKRARTIYLQDVTVRAAGLLGDVLIGVEVDSEGDEVHGRKFDERRHFIALGAVIARTPMRMDNTYGELVEAP